ncbi:hypothetical protein N7495_002242 [Penicillium taxi]|uniref:uncharacterized protein n=1 Tax=Penicillium taxi TaxID=168475 RepID=UPI0025451AD6|nr:uncharacterized protein N7495_002242 [Penicillium taxi]KAJ5901714.1 hypothetical protein N7495_002242 [Penicillium taxi]
MRSDRTRSSRYERSTGVKNILQSIASDTIDAQKHQGLPEVVWRKGRGLGDRSHSRSDDFSLTKL